MDPFLERLMARAVTIDEHLSDDLQSGRAGDPDLAERRLAAWCRASANRDSGLFGRRLARDGLSCEDVLARFAAVRHSLSEPLPAWIDDAVWVEAALQGDPSRLTAPRADPRPFEPLLRPLVGQAEARLWSDGRAGLREHLTDSGHSCLRLMLLDQLSDLCAPPLYERFAAFRSGAGGAETAADDRAGGTSLYERFIADMRSGGFRNLFGERPVLLRLEARAGHGAGKPLNKVLDELTDTWTFVFWQLGVEV